jgi:hypothetical protein
VLVTNPEIIVVVSGKQCLSNNVYVSWRKPIFNKIEHVNLYGEYQLTMDGSLVMLGTNGTTTNIDIASPINDEEDQAMLNKKIISCSKIIILLLLYYESTNLDYIPLQPAADGNKLSLE